MSSRSIQIGVLGTLALCLLRVGIGWHFFKEGAKKFQGDGFTAQYFLEQATGPWSHYFQSWVPDRYGVERLNEAHTLDRWKTYSNRIAGKYGLKEKDIAPIMDKQIEQLKWFHEVNGDDIDEYLLELERYQADRKGDLHQVKFQQDRIEQKASELKGKVSPWLSTLKKMDEGLESKLYELAKVPPTARHEKLDLGGALPTINTAVKYVVIGVGILLMLGLFTRLACVAGIAFLLSVMATQPPWVEGAQLMHFYYQYVEVLALVVLATCGAGYFGGLDYIVRGLWNQRREIAIAEK